MSGMFAGVGGKLMTSLKNPFRTKSILDPAGFGDKPEVPETPRTPNVPTAANSQDSMDIEARLMAERLGRGRGATIFTGASGLSSLGNTTSNYLLGR